jgi:hypothetical protein
LQSTLQPREAAHNVHLYDTINKHAELKRLRQLRVLSRHLMTTDFILGLPLLAATGSLPHMGSLFISHLHLLLELQPQAC